MTSHGKTCTKNKNRVPASKGGSVADRAVRPRGRPPANGVPKKEFHSPVCKVGEFACPICRTPYKSKCRGISRLTFN